MIDLKSLSKTGEKILALDPASFTGYAHSDGHHGCWSLSVHAGEHPGQRLVRLRDYLYRAATEWGFHKIAFEDASFGSHHEKTKQFHNQLRGVIVMVAAELGLPIYTIKPNTLKKFATGYGAASKSQMIRACKTLFGVLPRSDDEADAIMILVAAHQNVQPEPSRSRPVRGRRRIRPAKGPKLFR